MPIRAECERATQQQNCGMCTHHVHSVAVQQLFCCQPTEAVYKLLFVKQERLQPTVEGVTLCYAGLVQFVQLPDHCTQGTQHSIIYFSIVYQPLFHFTHIVGVLTLFGCVRRQKLAFVDVLFSGV